MSELITETTKAGARGPETGKKKASPGARKPRVAKSAGKSNKKATPAAKAPKTARAGKAAKEKGAREGSKTGKILALIRKPGGATLKAIMDATGWQAHSVRGFISGTLGRKMGLTVASTKGEDGERRYSVKV